MPGNNDARSDGNSGLAGVVKVNAKGAQTMIEIVWKASYAHDNALIKPVLDQNPIH